MKTRILTPAFLVLALVIAHAQPRNTKQFYPTSDSWHQLVAWPLQTQTPFYALSFSWNDEATPSLKVRFGESPQQLGSWQVLQPNFHLQANADRPYPDRQVTYLMFVPPTTRWIELRADQWPTGTPLYMHVYSPGYTGDAPSAQATVGTSRDCPCPLPPMAARSEWCPDGTCPPDPTPIATTFTHMIVHHSASPSTANDWAAVVRSIWDYHVNVNGWDDIGYNYLIAPDGTVFEGRGNNILGAHFCGTNTGAMGICMIGTWIDNTPPDTALLSLRNLLAWKSCDEGLDPLGSSWHAASGLYLHHISGHRDGCATQCPGQALYDHLSQTRQEVEDYIANECTQVVLPAPQLQAQALSPSTIALNWTDPGDETAFELERSVSFNNNYTHIATIGADTLSWTDEDLTPNTGYFYRIRALLGDEASPWSNEVFLFTPLSTSTLEQSSLLSLSLAPNPTTDYITLSWQATIPIQATISIFGTDGRQWYEQPHVLAQGKGSLQLPTGSLPIGQYFLQLTQSARQLALPFVKK